MFINLSCDFNYSFNVVQICETRLDWEREYSLDKVQDIVTRWQVQVQSYSSLSLLIDPSLI